MWNGTGNGTAAVEGSGERGAQNYLRKPLIRDFNTFLIFTNGKGNPQICDSSARGFYLIAQKSLLKGRYQVN